MGVTAMISAAKPVGTHCSAQARPKLPPTSSRHPMVARRMASFSVIRMLRPIRAQNASISDPAMAKRMAHITAGGSPS